MGGAAATGVAALAIAVPSRGASGVGGLAAGLGSLLAFSVPRGTRCDAGPCAGTNRSGSAAGVAAAGVADGGGGALSGSNAATLISSLGAGASLLGADVPGALGMFAQADNAAVSASIDTNVLMSRSDRLFVTAHRSSESSRGPPAAKPAVYQVEPSYASLNISLSNAPATLFSPRTPFIKKPAVTRTAGISV